MKLPTLLTLGLLLAAAFVALPSAQAAPPGPQCVLPCDGPIPDPEEVPTCKPVDRYDNGGTLHTRVDADCHIRIDNKPYDCVWNCGWHTVVDTPYLTIRTYGQNSGEPASASAAPPPGIQPPPQCVTSPCCFAPCPPPCYDTGCPPPVACRDAEARTSDLLAYMGPQAGAVLHRDCTLDLYEDDVICPSGWEKTEDNRRSVGGRVDVSYDSCEERLDCTCDPLPIEFTSANAAAIEPPITIKVVDCVQAPCPPIVRCSPREVDGAYLFGAYVESDCDATIGLIDAYRLCPPGLDHQQVRRTQETPANDATVVVNYCAPGLDCACDPILQEQSASAIEPPVGIEFVQCTTAPCPPQVWCNVHGHAAVFQYDMTRSCGHVTLTQDPLPCEGTRHETTTQGPLTVRRSYCGPGIDPSAASMQPPIVCVMAPCGPQCIVPCVPQVVPTDCELREATPQTVGPLAIPANPRTLVWGSSTSDCTIDVEPVYDCVGGWGFDRHVTAAFIDVTARVCTGGPFPPALVQVILDALALE
ncbi:MAG: hypothetical protein WC876_01230 [Candidatus Thermoplasmatota archaeon]|jgi:hypothetical protein